MNLIASAGPGRLGPLTWAHEPARWEALPEGGLRVYAPAGVHYFHDPAGVILCDAAPFLWLPVEGDFVARLRTRPHFDNMYDSGCLMVRHDADHWAKICYESTDFGTRAVVSVVNNALSDDANGVDLGRPPDVSAAPPEVWLQLARVGDCVGLHYALDGQDWHMVRYFALQMPRRVRVGMVAQCPAGPGSVIDWLDFRVEQRKVANLRAGV